MRGFVSDADGPRSVTRGGPGGATASWPTTFLRGLVGDGRGGWGGRVFHDLWTGAAGADGGAEEKSGADRENTPEARDDEEYVKARNGGP